MSPPVSGAPPPYDERRPQAGAASCVEAGQPTDRATVPLVADSLGAQLRRRRGAAWRCEPLPVGRDPLDRRVGPRPPSDYSLTPRELRAEWRRLVESGWPPSEVARALASPGEASAA